MQGWASWAVCHVVQLNLFSGVRVIHCHQQLCTALVQNSVYKQHHNTFAGTVLLLSLEFQQTP
jgi:hypothetical protein